MGAIGYQWLIDTCKLQVVQPLAVESTIGKTRGTYADPSGSRRETYPEQYRPQDTLAGHITFALKYEGVHLELLSRLFNQSFVREELEAWLATEPTGAYARRACFFCEWLHPGKPLAATGVTQGNYVDAMDPEEFITGIPVNNQRWRVRDNLPGVSGYCPVIRRTGAIRKSEQYDLAGAITDIENDFGIDILMRSAVWMTIKESRASFQIEHEQDKEDRVRRFAAVMGTECGKHADPLLPDVLAMLQRGILGDTALRFGPRKSPVYVGHDAYYRPVVDYVAPHWNDAAEMLCGLSEAMRRTDGGSSIVRAAVASFGFVYIHPMADGNGRISRFLINDVLRRDGVTRKPFIIPVSATIARSQASRADYDRVLETFSGPLMNAYADACTFSELRTADDGVEYNFHFNAYDKALPAWRYPDLTAHAEYMADVIDMTLTHEMREEASFLKANDTARRDIKEYLEAPDNDLDGIIRSIRQNNNTISGKLKAKYPILDSAEMESRITRAVASAFLEIDADQVAARRRHRKQ